MNRIRPEVQALADRGNITLDEYKALHCSGWERDLVLRHLADDALIYVTEEVLRHMSPTPYTFEYHLVRYLVPQLLKRLKEGL